MAHDPAVLQRLPGWLARWLPGQRWFGGKGRLISRVAVSDSATLQGSDGPILLALAEVEFVDGGRERYFAPTLAEDAVSAEPCDALAGPVGGLALFQAIEQQVRLPSERSGHIVFSRGPAFDLLRLSPGPRVARPLGVEQSNTSVVLDEAVMLKCFRRVYDGPNPDLEVPRFLATRTRFDRLPRLIGSIEYFAPSGEAASLAIAQELVQSRGDGWSCTLRALERLKDEASAPDLLADLAALGRVTAELHLALASDPTDPDFVPQPVTSFDLMEWEFALLRQLDRSLAALERARATLPVVARPLAERVLAGRSALYSRFDDLRGLDLADLRKTRCHGDYHLGQVLRTADGWLVLDFEGEPLRPLAERRARHSPLRDVAGMLRSFSYARQASLRRGAAPAERLSAWEQAARSGFLEAYFRTAGRATFLPDDVGARETLVRAFELEKALYELEYELNNRPDWVEFPLTALAGLLGR